MPFIFLLLFGLICLQTHWPAPPGWLEPAGCAVLVGALVFAAWLLAELIARVVSWQMTHHPELRGPLLRRYARWRRYHFIGLLVGYLLALYGLGWGQVLEGFWRDGLAWLFDFQSDGLLPGVQIGLMAPFFAGLILAWEQFYRVEKTAYEMVRSDESFMSRQAYVLLQIRHQLLLVLPPIMLLLLQQTLFAFMPDWSEESYGAAVVAALIFAVMFLLMPLFLRFFLGLRPMPPGPLRSRLEEIARAQRFRYSNILVWNTRNLFANALVTGFLPWVRYIVLTDRLVEELTPEEIEAVFGHEIGHVKHQHFYFYLAFLMTSFILIGFCWETGKTWAEEAQHLAGFASWFTLNEDMQETLSEFSSFAKLTLLAGYTLLVFGFLSRRCERQADLYGSQVVSTDVFISALEKVADINGIPRDRHKNWLMFWQHPTIGQRIEFLRRMRDNPTLALRFHRSIALLRWSFFLLLGFLLWYFELPRVCQLLLAQ